MLMTASDLRKEVRKKLPDDAFAPKPYYLFIPVLLISTILLFSYFILKSDSGCISLVYSIILGFLYTSLFFFTHHLLHGCITKSKPLLYIFGQPGFLIFFLPVEAWLAWHNKIHHTKTNSEVADEDPDGLSITEENRSRAKKIFYSILPKSKNILTAFFLFYFFIIHSQIIIWYQYNTNKKLSTIYKSRSKWIRLQSLTMMLFWILTGYSMGIYNALFVILIPMLLSNFGILSYISTNHLLMPLTKINHPLLNSMSLKTLKFFDIIHFNFSHHVEHHIFPTLHWKYYPIIRQYLKENTSQYYVCPSHVKALIYLYKTPREYKDNNTLFNSKTGESFFIEKIHNEMQNKGYIPIKNNIGSND